MIVGPIAIPLMILLLYTRMMLRLKSGRNFSLKFDHQHGTLVYIIILLGYGSSLNHMGADAEDEYEYDQNNEEYDDVSCQYRRDTLYDDDHVPLSSNFKHTENLEVALMPRVETKQNVVVFDTYGTICCEQFENEVQQGLSYVASHSECPYFRSIHESVTIFLPHLRILLDYLLSQHVRIVFFSSSDTCSDYVDGRRIAKIIPKLLKSFWGNETYEKLRLQGQFRIYSGNHRSDHIWGEGLYDSKRKVKDLKKVIGGQESLSNTILVDGNPLSSALHQEPIILVRTFYPGTDRDSTRLNSVYYMLGLFKTYFEIEKYRKLPMRDAFTQILPAYIRVDKNLPEWYVYFAHDQPFVHEMMNVGLSAVREEVSSATLYM